jgi:DNA helicase-2/ATP-dependent DNA helicase PcrA
MLALDFADPASEAEWIAARIEGLRGMPFQDAPGSSERGLSWSDCAVLFRTVKDASPLVAELRARGIPFIIKGLAKLFDAPEVVAMVGMFRFMVGEINSEELRQLFDAAQLIENPKLFDRATGILNEASKFESGERWGTYNIQRLFLNVLEALEISESNIPGAPERAELVMYQLGKFSQVISDFESIYFSSSPERKYASFVRFLTTENQAPSYYEEADESAGYATPDAVTITTVHRSKGMQWPAVFIPSLRRNRFPSVRRGGVNVFHVIPDTSVPNGARYLGGIAEENRLFYVAVTRAQKFLYMTWAPIASNQQARNPSDYFRLVSQSDWVLTSDLGVPPAGRIVPVPKVETPAISISFSEMKYLLECPYHFKLRFMYGFNPPIHEALGYGKGLHDALAELHKRVLLGDVPDVSEASDLIDRHLHTPYAYPTLREQLRLSAIRSLENYFHEHASEFESTIHSEKQIEVVVAPGVTVNGRIDLIRRLETGETAIVDFKSTEDAQKTDVTRDQLAVYALGYMELTGENADRIQILNLDDKGDNLNEKIDEMLIATIKTKVESVAAKIRESSFPCGHDHTKQTTFNDLAWLAAGAPRG